MLPEYDLVVIGSGPAGQKGAIAAAKARKNVAVVDRTPMIGGVSVHTGTIPSKTLREAIFQLTSRAVKAQYGNGRAAYGDISVRDVSVRVREIIERETDEQWSIGDYVLSGGELPALVVIDAIARLIPGTLGRAES